MMYLIPTPQNIYPNLAISSISCPDCFLCLLTFLQQDLTKHPPLVLVSEVMRNPGRRWECLSWQSKGGSPDATLPQEMRPYCWWFRNPAYQLRLVGYPILYRVFCIWGRWHWVAPLDCHEFRGVVFLWGLSFHQQTDTMKTSLTGIVVTFLFALFEAGPNGILMKMWCHDHCCGRIHSNQHWSRYRVHFHSSNSNTTPPYLNPTCVYIYIHSFLVLLHGVFEI